MNRKPNQMEQRLRVYVHDRPVGRLWQQGDEVIFRYDRDVDPKDSISLGVPADRVPGIAGDNVPPALSQHLPEGVLREVIESRILKEAAPLLTDNVSTDLALLRYTGSNQIGRVSVIPEDGHLTDDVPTQDQNDIFAALIAGDMGADDVADRYLARFGLGISGQQPKLLAETYEQNLTMPVSHSVFKFPMRDDAGDMFGEYFSLRAAAEAGLPTVGHAPLPGADGLALVLDRFDVDSEGNRYGVEDLCGLSGLQTRGRFNGDYLEACQTIERYVGTARAIETRYRFFDAIAFNAAIENGYWHRKDMSLRYDDAGDVELAPLYDLRPTSVGANDDGLAMPLNGSREWPSRRNLMEAGRVLGVDRQYIDRSLQSIEQGLTVMRREMIEMAEQQPDRAAPLREVVAAFERGARRSLDVDLSRHDFDMAAAQASMVPK